MKRLTPMVCRACGARTYWQHLSAEDRLRNSRHGDQLCSRCIRKGVSFRPVAPSRTDDQEVERHGGC